MRPLLGRLEIQSCYSELSCDNEFQKTVNRCYQYNSGCAKKVHGAANEFLAAWGRIGQWWLHGKTAVCWLNLDCQVILLCVCVCFTCRASVSLDCLSVSESIVLIFLNVSVNALPCLCLADGRRQKKNDSQNVAWSVIPVRLCVLAMSADGAPCYTSMSCASRTQLFQQLRTDKQKCWPSSLRRRLTFHAWRESFSTVMSTSCFCRTLERYCHDSWGWSTLPWAKMPKWRNFSALTRLCNVILCLMHRSTWCRILSNLVNESGGAQGCMEKHSWHWMAHGYSSPEAVFSHHGRCCSDVLQSSQVVSCGHLHTLEWSLFHCLLLRYSDPRCAPTFRRLYVTPAFNAAFPGLFMILRHSLRSSKSWKLVVPWHWDWFDKET